MFASAQNFASFCVSSAANVEFMSHQERPIDRSQLPFYHQRHPRRIKLFFWRIALPRNSRWF